jgi:hypothetical protein
VTGTETLAVVASTVAITVGLFIIFEKASGMIGKWASSRVEAGVAPMSDHLEVQIGNVSIMNIEAYNSIKEMLDKMNESNLFEVSADEDLMSERIAALEQGLKAMAENANDKLEGQS